MTDKEREDVNPYFCAKVLQKIAAENVWSLSYAEKAGLYGAIAICFNEADIRKWDYSDVSVEKIFWGMIPNEQVSDDRADVYRQFERVCLERRPARRT